MKRFFVFIFIISFFISCKKEKSYNPDEHIVYTLWYKLKSLSNDTLFALYIPNCFTPNGDGANDVFFPKWDGSPTYPLVWNFEIFNKDNSLIYKTSNLWDSRNGWNGEFNNSGNVLPIGSYVYKLTCTDNTTTYEYTGSVLLLN